MHYCIIGNYKNHENKNIMRNSPVFDVFLFYSTYFKFKPYNLRQTELSKLSSMKFKIPSCIKDACLLWNVGAGLFDQRP